MEISGKIIELLPEKSGQSTNGGIGGQVGGAGEHLSYV